MGRGVATQLPDCHQVFGRLHEPHFTADPAGVPGSLSEGAGARCRSHPTHFCNQYRVLQRRALQAYTRNPLNVAGRTMMAIFIGILGGLVFMKDVSGESACQAAAVVHRPQACIGRAIGSRKDSCRRQHGLSVFLSQT